MVSLIHFSTRRAKRHLEALPQEAMHRILSSILGTEAAVAACAACAGLLFWRAFKSMKHDWDCFGRDCFADYGCLWLGRAQTDDSSRKEWTCSTQTKASYFYHKIPDFRIGKLSYRPSATYFLKYLGCSRRQTLSDSVILCRTGTSRVPFWE